jgi:hypothetical protein
MQKFEGQWTWHFGSANYVKFSIKLLNASILEEEGTIFG